MNMKGKWMMLILLLGVMVLSGCGISKEGMMAYNEAKDAFQKATLAGAKQCAPCQYATAEAYLALWIMRGRRSIGTGDKPSGHFKNGVKIIREKSLEAIKLCQVPPKPAPPGPAPTPGPTPTPTPTPTPAPTPTPTPAPTPRRHRVRHLHPHRRLHQEQSLLIASISMPTRPISARRLPRRWTEMECFSKTTPESKWKSVATRITRVQNRLIK